MPDYTQDNNGNPGYWVDVSKEDLQKQSDTMAQEITDCDSSITNIQNLKTTLQTQKADLDAFIATLP